MDSEILFNKTMQFLLLVLYYCIVIDDNVNDNNDADALPLLPMDATIDGKYDKLKEECNIIFHCVCCC